jgi:hypothetical protein
MFNITNSYEHPTRPGHTIFRFYEKKRADLFTELLNEGDIWFESEIHEEDGKTTYFYGIKNRDLKIVNRKNYLVNAKFRRALIPNIYFRWGVIAIAAIAIGLAIIGYIKQH